MMTPAAIALCLALNLGPCEKVLGIHLWMATQADGVELKFRYDYPVTCGIFTDGSVHRCPGPDEDCILMFDYWVDLQLRTYFCRQQKAVS